MYLANILSDEAIEKKPGLGLVKCLCVRSGANFASVMGYCRSEDYIYNY